MYTCCPVRDMLQVRCPRLGKRPGPYRRIAGSLKAKAKQNVVGSSTAGRQVGNDGRTDLQAGKEKLPIDWQAYSANTTDAQARAAFERRYGYTPGQIKRTGGAVLAGPLKEKQP